MTSDKVVLFMDHSIGYQCLDYLEKNHWRGFDIEAIYTPKRSSDAWWPPLKSSNFPIRVYHPSNIDKIVEELNADYLFLISWKYLVPTTLLSKVRSLTVNLHYSALPLYRGVYPVNWQIIKGEEYAGVSFHIVTDKVDAGGVVWQDKSTLVEPDETVESLLKKLDRVAFEGFKEVLADRRSLLGRAMEQDESKATYYSRQYFQEFLNEVDLSKCDEKERSRIIRGTTFRGRSLLKRVKPL